jgi:hypothetical protein
MDALRQQKINQLVSEHNLPSDIVDRCVGVDGTVDIARLGIALQTQQFMLTGMTAQNAAEIESLKKAYKEAQARRDGMAMVRIQSRIYELGGRW